MFASRPRLTPVLDAVAVGLVALVVYALHGFASSLDRDQATFVYGGREFAHGTPPYRGIFNSVGPLGDMTAGVAIRVGHLVGLDDVIGARLIYLLLSAACVAALSLLAREALRSRTAAFIAPAAFLTFASFLTLATAGPREKTVMVLCLEVALLLLLRRRWFGAGVLTAVATLTWQPVILPALAAAAVAIAVSEGPRLRAAASYVVGGVLPTVLMAGYFLAVGELQLAWWGFVTVNLGYKQQPTILDSWGLLTSDYRTSLVVVVLGWVFAVATGVVALVRRRSGDGNPDVERALLVLGSGALVAGLWSGYAINGGPDLFVVLPFAALGVAAAVDLARSRLSPTAGRRVAGAVVAVAVVYAGVEAVSTRDHRLPAERRDVTRMVAALPTGSTLLSIYAPEVMVLAHRHNPYPWQLTESSIAPFLDDHLDGGLASYADSIARRRPTLIAVGRHATDGWLQPVLDQEYTRVGAGDHWAWWASNRLGPGRLRHLREVNQAAWGG